MRRLIRLLRGLLVALAAILLVLLAAVGGLFWQTLPDQDASRALRGLAAPVDISVDDDGVPRVRAASARDAAIAIGWLHARERLFQMDLTRRAASGELAELVGAKGLGNDRLMRVLGVRRAAEADLAGLPAETRDLLEAYATGVNAWIDARGRFAAPEYVPLGAPRHWSPVDSLLWGKMMGLYLSGNWRTELARAGLARRLSPEVLAALWPGAAGGPGRPEAALSPAVSDSAARLAALLPRFPDPFTLPESASDEWAVDARHSRTGAPLLAGDPHLGFAMPGTWYLARIETPEGVLAGATAPGVPFMVVGHNGRIAWTFTTTGADVQDLFVETLAGDGYLTPDGPRPFTLRREVIRVRGAEDVVLAVRETRHGPVVSDLVAPDGPVLALAAANLAAGDTAAAGLHALNRAADVAAAGRAASLITAPVQNLLVADRAGIALFVTGRVPLRRAGDGSMPARGDDGSQDWIGLAGGTLLPRVIAPESGRIVNGNERIAPTDFPVFMGRDWNGDWRARRIRERLGERPRHDIDDFAAMQVDIVSALARDLLPRLLRVRATDARGRTAIALLAGWDAAMDANRPEPLVYNAWMRRFRRVLLERFDIPDGAAVAGWEMIEGALSGPASPLCGGDCEPLLARALAEAMAEQAALHGESLAAWRWGAAHRAVFAHPLLGEIPLLRGLGERRLPAPGDDSTLFRASSRGSSFDAIHGAGFRGVYDLADLERSRFIITPGQSGNIASRHAWDLAPRWRDGRTRTLGPDMGVAWRTRLLP